MDKHTKGSEYVIGHGVCGHFNKEDAHTDAASFINSASNAPLKEHMKIRFKYLCFKKRDLRLSATELQEMYWLEQKLRGDITLAPKDKEKASAPQLPPAHSLIVRYNHLKDKLVYLRSDSAEEVTGEQDFFKLLDELRTDAGMSSSDIYTTCEVLEKELLTVIDYDEKYQIFIGRRPSSNMFTASCAGLGGLICFLESLLGVKRERFVLTHKAYTKAMEKSAASAPKDNTLARDLLKVIETARGALTRTISDLGQAAFMVADGEQSDAKPTDDAGA